ncbi:MAG TPA: DUF1175 family protein, partial [Pyrinomonadaceae bacterium]|nr:DUF1175 family protein [Pyrinomonadaceae bacterium]
MLVPFQLRAISKRSVMTASVLVILLATFIWNFSRSRQVSQARTSARAVVTRGSISDPVATSPTADADNDGIPDFAELRTFEDRENFRRWFTAIAETQFYQLSDQWKREQRDCAGL